MSEEQVLESRKKYGENTVTYKKENIFYRSNKNFIADPMVILLLIAATIYFLSGKVSDGFFLVSAIILISAISLYQNSRSRNALEKLKKLCTTKI